jgi:hypothetical protein
MAGFYIYSGAEGIYDHLLTDKFYAESKFVKEHLVLPMISYQVRAILYMYCS